MKNLVETSLTKVKIFSLLESQKRFQQPLPKTGKFLTKVLRSLVFLMMLTVVALPILLLALFLEKAETEDR